MPLKAVFLDIDGTLVDSNELHVAAWEEAFKKGGRRVEKADIRNQIGKGADQLIPALAPGLKPFSASQEAVVEPPKLATCRRHEEMEISSVSELLRPAAGLGAADRKICESH